jgi:uncharacterized membrane protein (DUF2068 family)
LVWRSTFHLQQLVGMERLHKTLKNWNSRALPLVARKLIKYCILNIIKWNRFWYGLHLYTVVGCHSIFLSLLTFDIAEHAQSNGGDGGM